MLVDSTCLVAIGGELVMFPSLRFLTTIELDFYFYFFVTIFLFHHYFGDTCKLDIDHLSTINVFAASWSLSWQEPRLLSSQNTPFAQANLIASRELVQIKKVGSAFSFSFLELKLASLLEANLMHINIFISSFYSLII